MRMIFLSLLMFIYSPVSNSEALAVTITGIEPQRGGYIEVYIFGKVGFPKQVEQAVQGKRASAATESLVFHFDIEMQEFAVKVLHDADSNEKVTKNWTGIIPSEGLGFSNGKTLGLTGPPSYRQCKVKLNKQTKNMNITLRYPGGFGAVQ